MWGLSSFWYDYQIARINGWLQSKAILQFKQQIKINRLIKHITNQLRYYQEKSISNYQQFVQFIFYSYYLL